MLRLTTLGAIDLRDRLGHPVRDVLAQPKRLALLIHLVLEGRRGPVSRDRLLALFWPESDEVRARNTLSQALHHLRQAVGRDLIANQGATALLVRGDAVWCDAVVFAEALEAGDSELALDLYHGEFCPGLFVAGAPAVEEWVSGERQQLRRKALGAARDAADRRAAGGDLTGAARAARRALALQPDDESDVRAMLALLDRAGDAAGALSAYHEYARRLTAELELEPAPETVRLVEGIRQRREQASLAAGAATTVPEPGAVPSWGGGQHAESAGPGARGIAPRPWYRKPLPAAAALLAVVAVALVLIAGPWRSPPLTAPTARAIAVFPFTVRGDRISLLGEGLVDLISAKLDGTSGLHAVDPRSVVAAARAAGPAAGRGALDDLARRLGARHYISGEVMEVGGRLQMNGALYDVGRPLPSATATVTGDTTRLFELVDDLSGRMLAGLLPGRDSALTRLAALTTASLPALKAYLAGEQAMRAGHDGQAAEAFREAAALDTAFALAQYRLAVSATWTTVPNASRTADIATMTAAAERHAQRLTPLVRSLLAGYHAYKAFRMDEAEQIYRRLTEAHPYNVEAWFMLGETHFHYNAFRGRSPLEARADFLRVLALDPNNAHAILHLARLAAFDGRTAQLDSLAARFALRYRDAERTLELRSLQAATSGNAAAWAQARGELEHADAVMMVGAVQSVLAHAQALDLAWDLMVPIMRAGDVGARDSWARMTYTTLPLAQGRWDRGLARTRSGSLFEANWYLESQALLAANPMMPVPRARLATLRDSIAARRPYAPQGLAGAVPPIADGTEVQAYIVGLLSLRLGDSAAVGRALRTLQAAPPGVRATAAVPLTHALRAAAARAAGHTDAALAELRSFVWEPFAGNALASWGLYERFLIGDLLVASGRDDEAVGWYQSFPDGYDLAWVAPAHLRLAEISQRRGDAERAAFHYRRFVSLWAGADPEFQPMVAQARVALARLGR